MKVEIPQNSQFRQVKSDPANPMLGDDDRPIHWNFFVQDAYLHKSTEMYPQKFTLRLGNYEEGKPLPTAYAPGMYELDIEASTSIVGTKLGFAKLLSLRPVKAGPK
jgi:hypothetical protein